LRSGDEQQDVRLTVGGPGTHFVGDFNRDPRIMGRQYEANARGNLLASKGSPSQASPPDRPNPTLKPTAQEQIPRPRIFASRHVDIKSRKSAMNGFKEQATSVCPRYLWTVEVVKKCRCRARITLPRFVSTCVPAGRRSITCSR
jgi:hypothetical protein